MGWIYIPKNGYIIFLKIFGNPNLNTVRNWLGYNFKSKWAAPSKNPCFGPINERLEIRLRKFHLLESFLLLVSLKIFFDRLPVLRKSRSKPCFGLQSENNIWGAKGQNIFCGPKHGFLLGAAHISITVLYRSTNINHYCPFGRIENLNLLTSYLSLYLIPCSKNLPTP